ncbi:MAG: 23S rRNA (adenine(2503)-C(2))-methyltransferase RlmN [Pseudomonadota bacterium]
MTEAAATAKTNLLGLPRPELEAFVAGLGEKPFRARQLMTWLYKRRVGDFAQMTDLAKSFRDKLAQVAEVREPEVITEQASSDGTRKWLLRAAATDGREQAIEAVFIPEPGRGTLCISSQVGCALDCSFCSTAQQGFNRNLGTAEIVGQVWLANRLLAGDAPGGTDTANRAVTNVVLMGMGEPLANYRNVLPALALFMDDLGFDLSRRRVTLSTSGLVPQLRKLAEDTNCALAVSLHAPNDALRDQLVPINRKHPIRELLDACWHYLDAQNGRSITFEYVMLDGVNDRPEHARELADLLVGHDAKVNLIPFNPFPGTKYRRSPAPVIAQFRDYLNSRGVTTTTRRTRGDDIDAACGQLAGRVHDRTTIRLGSKLLPLTVQS